MTETVVKPRPAGLVLGHNLRLKAGVAVTRDVNGQLAKLAFEGLFSFSVAGLLAVSAQSFNH